MSLTIYPAFRPPQVCVHWLGPNSVFYLLQDAYSGGIKVNEWPHNLGNLLTSKNPIFFFLLVSHVTENSLNSENSCVLTMSYIQGMTFS